MEILEKEMTTHFSTLDGKYHGQRSLVATVHGVAKSRTQPSDSTFTFHFHALEKEMATHSSILAWRIPGTEELGGLPSLGSQGQTQLKRLSSNSNSMEIYVTFLSESLYQELRNLVVNCHKNKKFKQ